jgi:AcrR family transcriptional regulator
VSRRREVSDAQIIKAARRVFLEHGTQAPVTLVAKELGVSPATLFVRMGSKRRLIIAALWPPDPPVLKTLEHGVSSAAPIEQRLAEIVCQLASYVDAEIPATFTLYAAGLRAKPGEDYSDVTPARLRRALAKWLRQAVRAGEIDCDPRTVAELILGTLEARAMHAFLARRQISVRETRAFRRSLVATVLGRRQSRSALDQEFRASCSPE